MKTTLRRIIIAFFISVSTANFAMAQAELYVLKGMKLLTSEGQHVAVEDLTGNEKLRSFDNLSRLDDLSETEIELVEPATLEDVKIFEVNGLLFPDSLKVVVSDGMLMSPEKLSVKEFFVRYDGSRERMTNIKLSDAETSFYRVVTKSGDGIVINSYRVASSK